MPPLKPKGKFFHNLHEGEGLLATGTPMGQSQDRYESSTTDTRLT